VEFVVTDQLCFL